MSFESARNRFPGIVTKVEKEGLVAVVHIQAGPHRVVVADDGRGRRRARVRARRPRGRVVKSTNVVVEVPRPE